MHRLIYFIISLLVLVGCSNNNATLSPNATPQEKIIGTWRREDNGTTRKYTTEGIMIPRPEGSAGCYTITADMIIHTFPRHSVIDEYQYTLSGDTLTVVTSAGTSFTYKRVDYDGTVTRGDREKAKVAQATNCPKP